MKKAKGKEAAEKGAEFKKEVERQSKELKRLSLRDIEEELIQKRISWFKNNRQFKFSNPASPREAFELFFFKYLKVPAEEVPVVMETENLIEWKSLNPCRTLEACQDLGLDTRKVCRQAYEKSTQALISQLDPRLRFHRSYQEIRPYRAYCKEWIVRVNFDEMMQVAITEAKISQKEGNKGYGAVVTLGNKIISTAHDTVVTKKDPSLHAEVSAIREAAKVLGDSNLCGAILFSTCEPCPMCTSLAVWANISAIVFGISIEETAQLGKSRIQLNSEEIIEKSPVHIEIIKNVQHFECQRLYL